MKNIDNLLNSISETRKDSSGNIMDAYGGLVSLSSSQP